MPSESNMCLKRSIALKGVYGAVVVICYMKGEYGVLRGLCVP